MLRELLTAATPKKAKMAERDKDVQRKRATRSEAARIEIPECVDPVRREVCLQDPERFLRTYFADRYGKKMERDHKKMMEVIYDRARYGGKQAIAAPRGRGKTEIVKGMLVFLVLAAYVRFPVAVASTTAHASKIFKDFRQKFTVNDLLYEDFPEVCHPVRELEGAAQRAAKQHVDGRLTLINWSSTGHLSFPRCPMPANLGEGDSLFSGVKMTYFGLDAALRGVNIEGDRPDFVLIDDPETEESARSLGQIETRERIIDQDIAGLAEQGESLSIVVLTTVQNRYCLSYQLTDRTQKHAWNGIKFGLIESWPDKMELWEDYIAKRHAGQAAGDEHGREAVQFYLDNREAMDAGAVLLTEVFTKTTLDDGTELVHSSLQFCFNKIADTSMAAFRTEYQNDPEPEEEITTNGLTAARVQSRISGLVQGQIPKAADHITLGLDLGKHYSHWVKIAWQAGAVGTIFDYGVMETHGLTIGSDRKAIELALLASLEVFADEHLADKETAPQLALIDSGTFTAAPYEFCRRFGLPWFSAKGWDGGRFRLPKKTKEKRPFLEAYASYLPEDRLWLYNVNTEFWKLWLQERFLTATFDDGGGFNEGSLSLFDNAGDARRHLSFAQHMVAEEMRMVPVFGKELKAEWFVNNRNNHFLDATALACAAGGCLGVRLVQHQPKTSPAIKKPTKQPTLSPFARNGRPFVSQRN